MKNELLILAIAATGLAALPIASHAADDKGGFFLNGSVGRSDYSKDIYDDTDTAYDVNLGYRWAIAPNFALGVEGGYANVGKWSSNMAVLTDPPSFSPFRDAELKGWTAGVNAHWNLNDNWYLSGRTGLFHADIKGDYVAGINGEIVNGSVDATSNKYYAGAGFGYDFSNNLSLGLNYDYYKADKALLEIDPGVVSVSGEMRF